MLAARRTAPAAKRTAPAATRPRGRFYRPSLGLCLILCCFAALLQGEPFVNAAMSMGRNDSFLNPPTPKNAGKFVPWDCALEKDNAPPLPQEADELFRQARALQKGAKKYTSGEEEEIFSLYKQAAEQKHWKAMQNLSNCYLNGFGTETDYAEANRLIDEMIAMGVPSGYYAKYVVTERGWGVPADRKKARELLHRAADLGYPPAQDKLGYYYMYPENRARQGMLYLVCAARQGSAESAYEIAFFLQMERNYLMAVEYYYRSVALGRYRSALKLESVFANHWIKVTPETSGQICGFRMDRNLAKIFDDYYHDLKKHPGARIPDLFKKHPIPENVLMTREQSRAMPSKLKDAFGGRWPDEIFPELAPDYLPPDSFTIDDLKSMEE